MSITVAGVECIKTDNARGDTIICTAPAEIPNGETEATVIVAIGNNIMESLSQKLIYTSANEIPLLILIPSVVVGFLVVLALLVVIMCCIICAYKSKHKKTEQRWTNLLQQMELLEIEMADECKRG